MTLQIEEGKFYKTRDGHKVGPMESSAQFGYGKHVPFSAETPAGYRSAWALNGEFYPGTHAEDETDLVAEWADDAPVSGFTPEELDNISRGIVEHYVRKAEQQAPEITKKTVLETALQTVADRGVPYGGIEDNFNRIARLWNAHMQNRYGTDAPYLDPADVAMMMALVKIARLARAPSHADSWVDVAGYAACGGEIGAKMAIDKPSEV